MRDGAAESLRGARVALAEASEWNAEAIEGALTPLVEALGVKPGAVYQPLRVAVTGRSVSPGIFETLSVLGREPSLERIDAALARLQAD